MTPFAKDLTRDDRRRGALWGALTGDALGVPVEFQSREIVRRNPVTGMRGHGTHNQPAGTWSDATIPEITLASLDGPIRRLSRP